MMMKFMYVFFGLIYAVAASAAAGEITAQSLAYKKPPKLTLENIDKATKVLRDPSVAVEKFQEGLGRMETPNQENVDTGIGGGLEEVEEIDDPTRMSGTFRAALNKRKFRTATTLKSTETPPFPKVSLAAIVYGKDEKGYAMLHVDDRTVLVRVGDKASFVDKGEVIEVVVQKINRSDVWLMVQPRNEIIVLR